MSSVEDYSGIFADDMLQLKTKNVFILFLYVFGLGLPWKFIVNNETSRRCSVTFGIF